MYASHISEISLTSWNSFAYMELLNKSVLPLKNNNSFYEAVLAADLLTVYSQIVFTSFWMAILKHILYKCISVCTTDCVLAISKQFKQNIVLLCESQTVTVFYRYTRSAYCWKQEAQVDLQSHVREAQFDR